MINLIISLIIGLCAGNEKLKVPLLSRKQEERPKRVGEKFSLLPFPGSMSTTPVVNPGVTANWKPLQKKMMGKIKFSTSDVPIDGVQDESIMVFGPNDEIRARAWWHMALRDFPIGLHPKTQQPFYFDRILTERKEIRFLVFAEINGKCVNFGNFASGDKSFASRMDITNTNPNDFYGAIASKLVYGRQNYTEADVGTETDFWCWNQSITFNVMKKDFHFDFWEGAALKLKYAMNNLPRGRHRVRLVLKYQLNDKEYSQVGVLHPLSTEIASGEFIMDTTNELPSPVQFFPLRENTSLGASAAHLVEEHAKRFLKRLTFQQKRVVLHVAVSGNWEKESINFAQDRAGQNIVDITRYDAHHIWVSWVSYVFNPKNEMNFIGDYISLSSACLGVKDTEPGMPASLPFVTYHDHVATLNVEIFSASFLPKEFVIPKLSEVSGGLSADEMLA
jgi:hypothetical protein